MSDYIIEMHNITKKFGDIVAISDGQFNLIEGEIHSLIGENGAGKSTLMKLLFGMYEPTSGDIIYKGEKLTHHTPKESIELGIGMVHQEFMLIDDLTVWENVILGSEPTKGFSIDASKAKKEIQAYIDKYKLDVDLSKKINQISVGEAQRVEIIKVLSKGADIIILDEPTAVLTPQEVDSLFVILQHLKDDGKTIVFISHKMNEVLTISDRITVMRQAKYVDTIENKNVTPTMLSQMMIGREVFLDNKKTNPKENFTEIGLKVENVWVPGDKVISKLKGVSLEVYKGEILGVAGIDGNGQLELEEAIAGLRKIEKGSVYISKNETTNKVPIEIRKKGLSYIPSDRNTRGLNRQMSIETNLVSTLLDEERFSKSGLINFKAIKENALNLLEDFDIRPRNPELLTSAQSGGNAQKVVVAREISHASEVLIASQPTRGVDIGAIESIRSFVQSASENGVAVLLISADINEILSLSDRIIVMFEGEIVANLKSSEANEENLGVYMMGGKLGDFAELGEELHNEDR